MLFLVIQDGKEFGRGSRKGKLLLLWATKTMTNRRSVFCAVMEMEFLTDSLCGAIPSKFVFFMYYWPTSVALNGEQVPLITESN